MCFDKTRKPNQVGAITSVRDNILQRLEKILITKIPNENEQDTLHFLFTKYIDDITPSNNTSIVEYLLSLDKEIESVHPLFSLIEEIKSYRIMVIPKKFTQIPGTIKTTPNPLMFKIEPKPGVLEKLYKKLNSRFPDYGYSREIYQTKIPLN